MERVRAINTCERERGVEREISMKVKGQEIERYHTVGLLSHPVGGLGPNPSGFHPSQDVGC